MSTREEAVELVVHHVVGTCTETIESALEKLGLDPALEDDAAFLEAVDGEVFECTGCGWWCFQPASESAVGEWVCEDCADQED
jgi:hypothetical protein